MYPFDINYLLKKFFLFMVGKNKHSVRKHFLIIFQSKKYLLIIFRYFKNIFQYKKYSFTEKIIFIHGS